MDKKKSVLNVSVSVAFKIITLMLTIVVKRILITACGNEVNGLNALYLSIVGFLSVAELGVGSAITFCMYKPIVDGDNNKVSALFLLFRRLYLGIGGLILLSGFIITPFIKYFAKDYLELDVNLYLTFILMLISVVITYLFSSKTALMNAYKNNYITTSITSGGLILQNILQIIVLLITGSFVGYLICRIVSALVQWVITEIVVRKKYSSVISNRQKVDRETQKDVIRNVKALFMHKIGYLLVNTVDSIVISIFVGVVVLGEYSNYMTILTAMSGILSLLFTSLTSVLGHLYVEESKETTKKYCEMFHLVNFIIGTIFFLGYYAIIDNLIAIIFFEELIIAKSITFVITLNGFIQFLRQSTLSFRDATGTFYNDRWKPIIEGIVNIILSVIFVKLIGVTGVIVATIITCLFICHIIEPYVLYKNAFCASPKKYYFENYGMIALFTAALFILNFISFDIQSKWLGLLINGTVSIGISMIACAVVLLFNHHKTKELIKSIKRR